MLEPQFGQNFVPAAATVPHLGQAIPGPPGATPTGLPHDGQNRVPGGIIAAHLGHGVAPPPYAPCIEPAMP